MTEEKEKTEVELTEVVTQTAQAFKLPTGEVLDSNQLLVWMANQLIKISKATSG